MTESFQWDAILALLRWQRTRHGNSNDAELLQTGFALTQPDIDAKFGPKSVLLRAERAFNLPWQRMASEVLQFAVFLLTRTKQNEVKQTRQALRLLQLSINVFAMQGDAHLTSLTLNSCNLLLSALADMVENVQLNEESLQTIQDVRPVFCFLFGLSKRNVTASFHMYRPPTNVYAEFFKRALRALLRALQDLPTSDRSAQKMQQQQLYVELLHAVLFVFQELQKTQTNKKKVFLAVAKTLLQYFVTYRHALVTLQEQEIDGVQAVILLLDQIVEDALFDTEHICQYESAMVHCAIWKTEKDKNDEALKEKDEKEIKKRRATSGSKTSSGLLSYQKKMFDELLNLLLDKDVQQELKASVGGFFEMLVRGFSNRIRAAADSKIEDTKTDLKTSRKRAAIVIATTSTTYSPFKFWSELCAVAYLAFQNNKRKKDFLPVLVTLYNALFRALCECDVYRMTEDTEERKQFHTMEKVLLSFLEVLNAEHCDEIIAFAARASEECEIVSNAVRCSPNLVNTCLVSILELFGLRTSRLLLAKGTNSSKYFFVAVTTAVVELIRAFVSMRLIDMFLNSTFSIQRAHEGLYMLLKQAPCDSALRKAFAALPPGQVDVLWKLFVKQIASFAPYDDGNSQHARGVVVARLLFQMFVQELHVVPQTRSTLSHLVSDSHQKLFSKLVEDLDVVASPVTIYQRELFCIFGELVMFDDVVDASVREQTFGRMLCKLQGDRFFTVMAKLLSSDSPTAKPKRRSIEAKAFKVEASGFSTSDGLSATGIVKLCVFWLRQSKASKNVASCDAQVARDGREKVTRLVVEYVGRWKCWEAVSFHLPELMASAGDNDCDFFFRNIVKTYISEASVKELDMSARHIICDAGFYEIASLQKIAPTSLTSFVQQFVDEAQNDLMTSIKEPLFFFKFLLKIPERYLKPEDCGKLLIAVLSFYKAIRMTTCNSLSSKSELCQTLLTWIQLHFKVIGKDIYRAHPALKEQLHHGCRYIFSQLAVDDAVSVSLISEVLGCYSDTGADVQIAALFNSVLRTSLEAEEPSAMTRKLKRAAIVVEALVAYRGTNVSDISVETIKFVEEVVQLVDQERLCEMESPLSFIVLTALVKYQSFLHKKSCSLKHQSLTVNENQVLPLHVKNIERALSASMKVIVTSSNSTDFIELHTAAWSFFALFCEEYSSFRALVSPLKTFGCLVAVSLSLVSQNHGGVKMEQPLQALVANANRDEFCLLLSTIVQELAAHDHRRKLSALRAMYLLLNHNRRTNASRRQLLDARKNSIVEALLRNFTLQSLRFEATTSGSSVDAKTLCIWSLKSFVLVFCKPELFTWKTQELQQIFTGFQPLIAAVSCWQAGTNPYALHELHELWTLSYTLLLRIVRHHFSLVNNVSHLVQATNALLQLLVLASSHSEYSKYCSDWSSNLARLYGYMKERDVQLRKHVVYLLMAFLLSVTRDKLPVRYQLKLRPGVFALLDVCSPYEKEQLFGALDATGKSLLKSLDSNYKLTHRYVGKV